MNDVRGRRVRSAVHYRWFFLFCLVLGLIGLRELQATDDESQDSPLPEINSPATDAGGQKEKESSELESAISEPAAPSDSADAHPSKTEKEAAEPGTTQEQNSAPKIEALSDSGGNSVGTSHITNVEFKVDGKVSHILVRAQGGLHYRQVQNSQMKQVVYYFDNTDVPHRLERAFDTSEFASPVALFTVLQMPQESPPQTKLIVQLRESRTPIVNSSAEGIEIEFTGDETVTAKASSHGSEPASAVEENIYSNNARFTGKTLKLLEIKNSDIQDVLRMLAKTSGYNIIVGDDVQGKVGTLSLQNVPWDQAFALVLQSKKLGYIKQGNVIRVATLQSLKAEKDDALANEQARIKVEELHTALIPISYANAGEISVQAKGFLTNRGSITVDKRTNTVIVRDIQSVVDRVQKLFAGLDNQPPQVSISCRIMEMQKKFTRTLGFSQLGFDEKTAGLEINNSSNYTGSPAGQSVTTLTASQFASLRTVFDIGELDNKIHTLANPTVTVAANENATVNSSITYYVFSNYGANGGSSAPSAPGAPVSPGTSSNGYNSLFSAPTLTKVTSNLTLNVLPIVANDGSINLKVKLKDDVPSGASVPITVDSRNVTTQILLENGDTAVIGGIFQSTVTEAMEGIPWLMRIPILGFFLSHNQMNDSRAETYMFLTAKILNPDESLKRSF